MPYYNASQAARELGVPDKTIRRWLKQGLKGRWKLTAQRTASGQLLISEADIERIKRAREQDRAQFERNSSPIPPKKDMPSQDVADLSQQIAELTTKVVQLEERIAVLERTPQTTPNLRETSLVMPSPQPSSVETLPREKPQNRASVRKGPLPDGCILASKFATAHNVNRSTFGEHMTQGRGPGLIGTSTDVIPERDRVAHESRPKPGRGHTGEIERYLTLGQQRAAILFWSKHQVSFQECDLDVCDCHTFLRKDE